MTNTILNTKLGRVENKIPDFSGLVKKTFYNAKISDIEKKYFTPSPYNKCTGETLDAKIKEKGLVDKSRISISISIKSTARSNSGALTI